MKAIKRTAAVLTAAALCACGCGNAVKPAEDGKLNIVCTVFPAYDWVREIMGGNFTDANVQWLTQGGSDPHNYQPSAEDMIKIADCDMLVCIGGESDKWALDALDNSVNGSVKTVEMLKAVGQDAKTEEHKEGMQKEREHDHGEETEEEYDEHVWLSLSNAKVICSQITDALCGLDPENADTYRSDLNTYTQKLEQLNKQFADTVEDADEKTLVFGDRFPFRYFVDDYGLDYYAAFPGCSAESEASFETVTFLAGKIDELKIDTVYIIESSDGRIARSIIGTTKSKDQHIAVLDSLQAVSIERSQAGETYLSIMHDNLDTIKKDIG